MRYLIVILLVFSLAGNSFAADKIERAKITYKGTNGFFFNDEIGTKILADLKVLKLKDNKIVLLKREIELKSHKIKLKEMEIEATEKISDKYKLAFEAEHDLRVSDQKLCDAKLKDKNKWYKTRTIAFIGGIFIGCALAVGLAFGLDWAKDQ